jgi:hypothetical protein
MLVAADDSMVFVRPDDDGCGGEACIRIDPQGKALGLAKLSSPTPDNAWTSMVDSCDLLPECP